MWNILYKIWKNNDQGYMFEIIQSIV